MPEPKQRVSIASFVNQIVMSPRQRNASLYSGQLVTLYLGLVNLWRRPSLCLYGTGCLRR